MTDAFPILRLFSLFLPFFPVQSGVATETSSLLSPPIQDGPVVVHTKFLLRDLSQINDGEESFNFTGVLSLVWRDPRQAFDPREAGVAEKIYQGAYQLDEIYPAWIPRIMLANKSGTFESDAPVLRVRPDGTSTLLMSVNAVASASLNMRLYPFDSQRLQAVFEVFGFDRDEVHLVSAGVESSTSMSLPQWQVGPVKILIRENSPDNGAGQSEGSKFVLSIDVTRKSMFVLRLVAIPLMLIVALSWSVFWMDRSSLGDRINLSFVGILTAVAYQIVIGDLLPHLSYVTLMHAFVNISFLIMCASVVMNLVVGSCDKAGRITCGDLIDRRCRWIFPLTYAGALIVAALVMFLAFPLNESSP